MEAGFDAHTFSQSWDSGAPPGGQQKIVPMNIALGATGTVEHLLLLRHALGQEPNAKLVVYGYFDLQMTEKPTGGWSDLVGNRAMAYYVEPYFAANLYAPRSRMQLFEIRLIGQVPMLVERLALWARVEKMRRAFGQAGLPPIEATGFGRTSDFASMDSGDPSRFQSLCSQCVQQGLPLAPPVALMTDETNKRGARFIAVEMPMPTAHRTKFYNSTAWHAYQRYVQQLLTQQKCVCIDATMWIEDRDFADSWHLAHEGATQFSTRLAIELKPILHDFGPRSVPAATN
jgi:hypothetical protein